MPRQDNFQERSAGSSKKSSWESPLADLIDLEALAQSLQNKSNLSTVDRPQEPKVEGKTTPESESSSKKEQNVEDYDEDEDLNPTDYEKYLHSLEKHGWVRLPTFEPEEMQAAKNIGTAEIQKILEKISGQMSIDLFSHRPLGDILLQGSLPQLDGMIGFIYTAIISGGNGFKIYFDYRTFQTTFVEMKKMLQLCLNAMQDSKIQNLYELYDLCVRRTKELQKQEKEIKNHKP